LQDTEFQYQSQEIHSWQTLRTDDPSIANAEPYFSDQKTSVTFHDASTTRQFSHPFAHQLLSKLTTRGLDGLFDFYLNGIPVDSLNTTKVDALVDAFGGAPKPIVYDELKRANSLYNWEAAFHAPMLLVDRILAAQQFDQALKMCHYVLNPYAAGTNDKRFWQFFPFKEIDATNVLEKLFLGLQPNTPDAPHGQINEWRNKPFQPHVVARSRPSAYMK
jgi:hypothetical protein